jgi:hypothetical protein
MRRKGIVNLLKHSIVTRARSEATIHAAAMAYYAIFSDGTPHAHGLNSATVEAAVACRSRVASAS